jgi:hypothetical protein
MRNAEAKRAAKNIERSRDPVCRVAKQYGVKLIDVMPRRGVIFGPQGGGILPRKKSVYVGQLDGLTRSAELLHEIVHVVVWVPARRAALGVEEVDEGDLLLPFERELAKACMPHRFMPGVIRYQEASEVWRSDPAYRGMLLRSDYRYTTHWRWLAGIALAQRLGILDDEFFPTFQMPDWSRITVDQKDRLLSGESWMIDETEFNEYLGGQHG